MNKKQFLLINLFLFFILGFSIPEKAQAFSPSAFGWTLGERIYGYPQWPKYYRWRVIELGKWPVAHRYNAFMSVGPYQRYEIQVTPFGRVSVISGFSDFGTAKACLVAQMALAPSIKKIADTNNIGYMTGAYSVNSTCTPTGTLGYQVTSSM